MKRPGKPQGQYYLFYQTLDSDYGIIIGLTVTPGEMYMIQSLIWRSWKRSIRR